MTGGVTAIPDSRMPTPLALSAPCTRRKSVARGLRAEACWMTAPSLLVLMAATTDTMANTGSSAQNRASGVRSIPGQAARPGRSNQDASTTARRS